MIKIMTYSSIIHKFQPNNILCSAETSFTSSILTSYCEQQGVSHINVMHGLIKRSLKLAFSHFTVSSVWERCFADIYISVKAIAGRFVINKAPMLRYTVKPELEKRGRYVYYLQDLPNEVLHGLSKMYTYLESNNKEIIFRLHPRYNKQQLIKKCIPGAIFEDVDAVDIDISINQAEVIIARMSTVLYQAYLLGKKIVIDDISNPKEYIHYKELDTYCWCKDICTLSDWIRR